MKKNFVSRAMFRQIIIFVWAVAAGFSQDLKSCMSISIKHEDCCNYEISEEYQASIEDCLKKTHSVDDSCDFHVCLGKKEGFVRPNGTFDKIALEELLEKDLENDSDVLAVLKEKCLSEELDSYIQEDPCYLKELGNCLTFYMTLTCKDWEDSDECNQAKKDIENCQKLVH